MIRMSFLSTLMSFAAVVAVSSGEHMSTVQMPLAEDFGRWTTGAYRAGKSRWVGDESIEHGECDMFRYKTLGIQSIIQSPSNETFNAIVEITHPKRQIDSDMAYINVTLHDKNGDEWLFHRNMFENSDIITHLDNPQVDAAGVLAHSTENFRFIISIDFEALKIPGSMKNTVDVDVYSLRQGIKKKKLDALDCVKLHDVGTVHGDVHA
jgi:hypothetical protein